MNLHALLPQFLETPPYYPCMLLVNPDSKRLQAAVQELAAGYGWPRVDLSGRLAEHLIRYPIQDRPGHVAQIVQALVGDLGVGPVLCGGIDLLFEPSLSIDPLAILRMTSRTQPLIVAWAGTFAAGILAYAVPEHAHYRTWSQPDLCPYCIQSI